MRRAVLALLLVGCSYDWAVRDTSPADGGGDAPPVDAPVSDVTDGAPVDTVAEPPTDGSPTDNAGGSDVDACPPTVDAAECQQLLQTAMNALPPALACMPTMSCTIQVADWCGCPVYVANGTSPAYMAFVNAVSDFDSACCHSTIDCGDTCPPTSTYCVVADATAQTYACIR
jgi:hypothetical protein